MLSNHDLFIYKLCTPFYVHTNVYLYLVGWRSATQIYLYRNMFNQDKFNHCMYSQRQELVHSIEVSKWNGFLDLTFIFKYMYYLRILNCSSWKFKEYSKIQKRPHKNSSGGFRMLQLYHRQEHGRIPGKYL